MAGTAVVAITSGLNLAEESGMVKLGRLLAVIAVGLFNRPDGIGEDTTAVSGFTTGETAVNRLELARATGWILWVSAALELGRILGNAGLDKDGEFPVTAGETGCGILGNVPGAVTDDHDREGAVGIKGLVGDENADGLLTESGVLVTTAGTDDG
ncbi:MAG: hypothetical protein ABH872_00715 [Candidatus Omnitrophota bacterium]